MAYWLVDLLRVRQWYKNLLVFLPIFFSGNLFGWAFWLTVAGFCSFCLASSFCYIINDTKDLKADLVHPEKRERALASGRVPLKLAYTIAALLFVISICLAAILSWEFLLLLLLFIINSVAYSIFFKDVPVLELFMVCLSFVLRSVAGSFVALSGTLPYVIPSGWLVFCTFSLAMFLVAAKRRSDSEYLGKKARLHRNVLGRYTQKGLKALGWLSAVVLISAYVLYSVEKGRLFLLLSIPFGAYCIVRYLRLADASSPISRHLERFYKDRALVVSMMLWIIMVFLSIYMKAIA
jgi:decaprenyl-phosphate phosphoribosyltransferase